jgi:hypothetical protein
MKFIGLFCVVGVVILLNGCESLEFNEKVYGEND